MQRACHMLSGDALRSADLHPECAVMSQARVPWGPGSGHWWAGCGCLRSNPIPAQHSSSVNATSAYMPRHLACSCLQEEKRVDTEPLSPEPGQSTALPPETCRRPDRMRGTPPHGRPPISLAPGNQTTATWCCEAGQELVLDNASAARATGHGNRALLYAILGTAG